MSEQAGVRLRPGEFMERQLDEDHPVVAVSTVRRPDAVPVRVQVDQEVVVGSNSVPGHAEWNITTGPSTTQRTSSSTSHSTPSRTARRAALTRPSCSLAATWPGARPRLRTL